MTEDAETITTNGQDNFIGKILFFRDHLRTVITSDTYREFAKKTINYKAVFKEIEKYFYDDLSISIKLEELSSPRDFFKIENYIERVEWQYFKTTAIKSDFQKLLLYAQYDRRYLRSVSKTTPKHEDIELQNHNLPMILLFRQSLNIKNNNKKAAVGLLDEALRIPYGWIKNIPKEILPSSVALENFLLPGNKEDGSDKSRHWNVFGGLSLYKSPRESFIISIKREMSDLKNDQYSVKAMNEFIRDTIANINGIYYIVSIKNDLIEYSEAYGR